MDYFTDRRLSKNTTAAEVMEMAVDARGKNFEDKVAVITGANSGIGLESAVALAKAGCVVVVVCRSLEKSRAAISTIQERAPNCAGGKLIPAEMECGSLRSVEKFARAYLDGKIVPSRQLNILINNAGIMQLPKYTPSEDGYESQVAVNFLAGYLLVKMLMPLLQRSASEANPSRIVNVSSIAHTFMRRTFNIDEVPVTEKRYSPFEQYCQSKLLQILHAQELNKKLANGPNPVITFALHPGVIATGLSRNAKPCTIAWWIYKFPNLALKLGLHKTVEAGAAPTIRCALDPIFDQPEQERPLYINDDCNPTPPKLPTNHNLEGAALMKKAEELVNAAFD